MFKKRIPIGLDLGSDTFKCALLTSKRAIQGVWTSPVMPDRQGKDDTPAAGDLSARLTAWMRECQKANSDITTTVHTLIGGEGTIARYLEFPPLSPKELAVAAPAQAMRHVPYPSDSVVLSFMPVDPLGDGKKSAIFFVVEQKERVAATQALLAGCGLKAQRLEATVLALIREFVGNHSIGGPVALVHCGFRLTHVVVLRGRHPYYYREIRTAGRDFTYAFQQGMQCTWAAAEAHKVASDAAAREVPVEPFLQRWLKEVQRTLTAFENEHPGQSIERVYLSGGSARWKNLDQRLAEHLGKPVDIDGWDLVKCTEPAPLYKVSAGLGMED